jgi:alkyl hydroperoxide reductase subunit AhpF
LSARVTLTRRERRTVGTMLTRLERPVAVHLFLDDSDASAAADAIWTETAALSRGRVGLVRHRADAGDPGPAPVAVFCNDAGQSQGVRFVGVPGGYLYQTVIDHLLLMGGAEPVVRDVWRPVLTALDTPLHIRVWCIQNCPHCPHAIRIAERLAAACPGRVQVEVVDGSLASSAGEVPALMPTTELERPGIGRRVLSGVVPEAVWVEAAADLAAMDPRQSDA